MAKEIETLKANFTVDEVCEQFRISSDTFYRHANAKRIKTILFGRKRLVPAAEVERLQREGLTMEAAE
jgi:excisionase family DNA binding protein